MRPTLRPEPPMPEIAKKHFEEKRGYANYYFNLLNQRRIWKAWSRGQFPMATRRPGPLPASRPRATRSVFGSTDAGRVAETFDQPKSLGRPATN